MNPKPPVLLVILLSIVLGLLGAGCEATEYETGNGHCAYANGVYEIDVYLHYDRDQVEGRLEVPLEFQAACDALRGGDR